MKKFSVLIVALVLALGFNACKDKGDDPDTTLPTINIVKPADGTSVIAGQALDIEVQLADDKGLAKWDYAIVLKTEAKKNTETWEVKAADTSEAISDKTQTKTASVTSPENAKLGVYTLTVTAEDTSGNKNTASKDFTLALQ